MFREIALLVRVVEAKGAWRYGVLLAFAVLPYAGQAQVLAGATPFGPVFRGLRPAGADTSLLLTRQALRLARSLRFERGLLEALFNLSYYQRAHSQYDSAIYYARLALPLAARTGNRYTQTRVYYNLARIYQEQGNYAAAVHPSLNGLALARAMGSPRVLLFQLVLA
ncbi:hypothetical protein, partial [Hymenobacter agri]